jgi:hypothetical protein
VFSSGALRAKLPNNTMTAPKHLPITPTEAEAALARALADAAFREAPQMAAFLSHVAKG